MVDVAISQNAIEAGETPEASRPNQRDLVALYARRLELTSPAKVAHPSWPEKAPRPDLDEWAAVELVQFGRPFEESHGATATFATEPFELGSLGQDENFSASPVYERCLDLTRLGKRSLVAARIALARHARRVDWNRMIGTLTGK